ncbi:hypothetical protein BLNAU_25206 [Blattamonas nauphoetae]|uniref:Uncharacterized protein n=1 Tax=Blattamonas nauphoetae TaxID=2049346 RepID=A0ABQ9WKA1_9EUKA|nr:hypothetical protein BLNAU_25206 [Blattamonas nauphoetae]
MCSNLSQTIKELNEFVTSELLTMTVLKKEIVTSAIFLPRAALFVAEGSRQFRKCKSVEPVAVVVAPNRNGDTCLSGRNSNCNGQLDQIHTAKHHLNEEDRPDFIVFSGPRANESSVLEDSLRERVLLSHVLLLPLSNSHFTEDLSPNTHIPFTARVRVPLIFDRLSVFTGFQHIPSRDMPNLSPNVISLKRLNCLQSIQEMLKPISGQTSLRHQHRFQRGARSGCLRCCETRFESAAVNEVLRRTQSTLCSFLHLERLYPPDGRHYPIASDVADGTGPL